MTYLCAQRSTHIFRVDKLKIYSLYLTNKADSYLLNSKNHNNNIDKRQFSLQSTIDSIIKTQSGIFKTLSESVPVSYCQDFLLSVHTVTGLPWWASIILSTIVLRSCVTVPLAVYQNYILAKVENLSLEMPAIVEEMKTEMAIAIRTFKWDERQAKITYNRSVCIFESGAKAKLSTQHKPTCYPYLTHINEQAILFLPSLAGVQAGQLVVCLKKQWNNLIIRDNCHPFKASLLLWVQLPMWVCLSISFRNLVYMLPKSDLDAQITLTELTVGGVAWIPNLAIPDVSLILPVTLGLVSLAIIEIQSMSKSRTPTKLQKYATNLFRGISIILIPIAATVPSVRSHYCCILFTRILISQMLCKRKTCLALYWVTSSCYGLVQNLILMSPKVKRMCKIPKTTTEIEQPYSQLVIKFQQRFHNKNNSVT